MKKLTSFFRVFLLALISISFFSCGPSAKDIPINDIVKHLSYQASKEPDDLTEEYSEILKNNPNSPNAYFLLAHCKKDFRTIYDLNSKALSIDPNFYFSNLAIGVAYKNSYAKSKESTDLLMAHKYLLNAESSSEADCLVFEYLAEINEFLLEGEKSIKNKIAYISNSVKYISKAKYAKNHQLNKIEYWNSKQVYYTKILLDLKSKLNDCLGKSGNLRNIEIARMSRISSMIIDNVTVTYIGDCKYQVDYSAFDQMYGNWINSSIQYEWTETGWNRISE